jgi:two-component system chemotaxis sensor kinase CheA
MMMTITPPDSHHTNTAALNEKVQHLNAVMRRYQQVSLGEFATHFINAMAEEVEACVAMIYVWEESNAAFACVGTYGCPIEKLQQIAYTQGEGTVGQAAKSQRILYYDQLPPKHLLHPGASIQLSICSLVFVPIVAIERCVAVIELQFVKPPPPLFFQLIERMQESIALMLESMLNKLAIASALNQALQQNIQLQHKEEQLRYQNEALQAQQARLDQYLADIQLKQEFMESSIAEQVAAQVAQETTKLQQEINDLKKMLAQKQQALEDLQLKLTQQPPQNS